MQKKTSLALIGAAALLLSGCTQESAVPVKQKDPLQASLSKALDETNKTQTKTLQQEEASLNSQPLSQTNTSMTLINQYDKAILHTSLGDITFKFYADASPLTVENFLKLASENFYTGTRFHRVIQGFMIQGGDPNSKDSDWSNDGTGGPGYAFADEFNAHPLVKGSLAMANSGPNTNGSQFFIVTADATPWLDGKHTNFGEVVSGMNIVDKIESVAVNQNDHPMEDITVTGIDLIKK